MNQALHCLYLCLCVALVLSKCPGETSSALVLQGDLILHCEEKGTPISAAHLQLD